MSEQFLFLLNSRLRLLARRNVLTDDSGTLVRGSVDQRLERIRLSILELLDQELDGLPLNDLQVRYVRRVERIIHRFRPRVRQLELAAIPFAPF